MIETQGVAVKGWDARAFGPGGLDLMQRFTKEGFTKRLQDIEAETQNRGTRPTDSAGRRPNMAIAWGVSKALGQEPPIDPSTVSRWFSGTVPDLETIWGIARFYEVNPGWLAFGDEAADPPDWLPMDAEPVATKGRGKRVRKV